MDTCQLTHAVSQDGTLSEIFLGVFPKDMIPRTRTHSCLIANTDKSNQKGTHWIAMYKDINICEFFDSYGRPPFKNKYLGKNYIYNNKILQSFNTYVCGEYCLYFLYYRCRGNTLIEIIDTLKCEGDSIVEDFVSQNFDICNKGMGMCCKALQKPI